MMRIIIVFILLITTSTTMFGQVTTISGIAKDAKYGAVVVTDTNEVYYLDKLESWDKNRVGKTVVVTGKVVTRKPRKSDAISADITTPIKLIKKPEIKIAEAD
ncbi:MAG TPA: hypothetical protein PKH83_12635 [Cyclobacteriaceae bacterium]|nr:hypothetical protein [Cyclobacteriaceae bacterium]HNU43340.1 hypothetical protein [Cyclobacteriaceae bacterium]